MVHHCQSLFLKICLILASEGFLEVSTALADTVTSMNGPASSTSMSVTLYPSSTTSFKVSSPSLMTPNLLSASSVSAATSQYKPSGTTSHEPYVTTVQSQLSGIMSSADHYHIQPKFSLWEASSLFMSPTSVLSPSTSPSVSQFSTSSTTSISFPTTIDSQSSWPASLTSSKLWTSAVSPVVSSRISPSNTSTDYAGTSSIRQTLPTVSQTTTITVSSNSYVESITPSFTPSNTISIHSTIKSGMTSSISSLSSSSSTTLTSSSTTEQSAPTVGAIKDASDDGLVLGLSIGLSVAIVAIVCLLILVIFWKRSGFRNANETKTNPSALSNTSTNDNNDFSCQDDCRVLGEDLSGDAGIVNPVFVLYEENPDFNFA